MAVIYNADGSLGRASAFCDQSGKDRSQHSAGSLAGCPWRQLADQEQFRQEGIETPFPIDGGVFLPPLGCGLWVTEVH